MFDDFEIEKRKSNYSKYPINIHNVDIDKAITSKNVSFGKEGFKYFIGYKNEEKVKLLCIMLPMSWCIKYLRKVNICSF